MIKPQIDSLRGGKHFGLLREIFLYGIIGVVAATTDGLIYYLLTRFMALNPYISNFFSINAGIALSFYLNAFYNFRKTDVIKKRVFRFFVIGYVGLVLSMVILYVGTNLLSYNDLYVKIFSVFVVAAVQFVLNKLITFKGEKNE